MAVGRKFPGFCLPIIFLCGIALGYGKRPGKADVVIILDIGRNHKPMWNNILHSIIALTNRMSVSPSTTRLALITVGSQIRLRVKLDFCTNRECFKAELKKIRYNSHSPSVKSYSKYKAVELALKILRKEGRRDAKKYIILIATRPSQMVTAYFKRYFAKQDIVLVSTAIQVYKGGHIAIKLKSSFYKGKVLPLRGNLPFRKGSFTKCKGNGKVFDECNRSCECNHGQMVNCKRVRKEFTEMSLEERRRFIRAFKTLASDLRYKKRYEKFVKIHHDYFFKGIHTQNYFLPWHRWYVLSFENMIREVDCRITVPYWDWAFWSKVCWKENIHIWNKHDYGLGGNGDPARDYCVQDGPFKEGVFKTPRFDNKAMVLESIEFVMGVSIATKGTGKGKGRTDCLRRSFNSKPAGVSKVKRVLRYRATSFARFEEAVRVYLHNSIHNDIGGHMCSTFASVTPEFYLHHTFLDKLWSTWQQRSSACMKAKFTNSHKKMSKFDCPHSQSELIDSSKLPGRIKVAYTDYYYGGKGRPATASAHAKSQGYKKKFRDVSFDNSLPDYKQRTYVDASPLFKNSDDDEPMDLDSQKLHDGDVDFLGRNVPEERPRDEADNEVDENDEGDFHENDLHSANEPTERNLYDRPSRGSSDAKYDKGLADIAEKTIPGLAKYGETEYDFWNERDLSVQSREFNEIRYENSNDKDCMKGESVSTKNDFVPAFEKVCDKDYLNDLLD